MEHAVPKRRFDNDVKKTFNNVETVDGGFDGHHCITNLGSNVLGAFAGNFYPGKNNESGVALEFGVGGIEFYFGRRYINAVQIMKGTACGKLNFIVKYCHG